MLKTTRCDYIWTFYPIVITMPTFSLLSDLVSKTWLAGDFNLQHLFMSNLPSMLKTTICDYIWTLYPIVTCTCIAMLNFSLSPYLVYSLPLTHSICKHYIHKMWLFGHLVPAQLLLDPPDLPAEALYNR